MAVTGDDSVKPGSTGVGQSGGTGLSAELTVATPSPGAALGAIRQGSVVSGTTLDHFEVLDLLGSGGFGEVYRARDTRLGRIVAIKVLPEDFARDAERRERFRREAMAASALNHPNICTVHDLIEAGGRSFIVMELAEGSTLHDLLIKGPLDVHTAVGLAIQITTALGQAHRAGILHRDVKSGNIIVTTSNHIKVLDFGLAKRLAAAPDRATPELTREGIAVGTLTYMSPEQLLGKPVDARSDLFSLGVVLYEMVTGNLPFRGNTVAAISDAVLHAQAAPITIPSVPQRLRTAILRLLEKNPDRRFASAEELAKELEAIQESLEPASEKRPRRGIVVALVSAAVLVAVVAGWFWQRGSRSRWARDTALPQVERYIAAEEYEKAFPLLRQAREILPSDPTAERLWQQSTLQISIETSPPDADVSYRPYRGDPNSWTRLGRTPTGVQRVPRDYFLWRIEKPGFAPAWRIFPEYGVYFALPLKLKVSLASKGQIPDEMVPVSGGSVSVAETSAPVTIADFAIDRFEVRNREFQKFVDAGGYQKREFWKQPFIKNGKALSFDEANAIFRDSTGRPGPATWELGAFPKGQEDHPVAGVSWYESAAYAEFAGKALPTIYHWARAAQLGASLVVVPAANFRGSGTLPVSATRAISGFGTSDMAGNVKEWVWNETEDGRYILGGGFGDATYLFVDADISSPWDRRANYGFRCVKLTGPAEQAAAARVIHVVRDFSKEKPVRDDVFAAYKGLYRYDKTPLDSRVERLETTDEWRHEKVSFNAAYGNERVTVHLFLPVDARPPYQAVIYFPGSATWRSDSFALSPYCDYIPKSGRVLVCPIYKSTYERRDELDDDTPSESATWRDHMILWSKDLGRSLDYLETRPDIDRSRFAYMGMSWGSEVAPILLAVDSRFRAAVLISGGMDNVKALPEADQLNFVTRVKVPVLMINGRYDNLFPYESAQLPFFKLLGTPESDKRRAVSDSGHSPIRKDIMRESLDWLDKYLGPIQR